MVKLLVLRSIEGEGFCQDGWKLIRRVIEGVKVYGAP
jgi:hypothetical protein